LGAAGLGAVVPVVDAGAGDLLAVLSAAAVGVADINLIIYSFITCEDIIFQNIPQASF
jgi:hypothetical protein